MDVNKYFSLVLLFSYLTVTACTECKFNDVDFSLLDRVWVAQSDGSELNITYKLDLCSQLNPNGADDQSSCHSGTLVCMDFGNGTVLSSGNVSVGGLREIPEDGEALFTTAGDACPEGPENNLTTLIYFKCGPLMGSPKFLDYEYCVSHFEWESHIFCKGDNIPKKDVPCSVYDERNRYDLSPLAKTIDGYLVSSMMDTDVFINVCRDIKPGTLTQACPEGAGACKKSKGKTIALGFPTTGLQIGADRRLMLHYTSPPKGPLPGECTTPPSTTITFICPEQGGSKDPLVINDFDCQYVIEWVTEYACPEATLTSDSCVLSKSSNDINIDLRPLTKPLGYNYPVNYTDSSGVQYTFFLNVCEELNIPCPDDQNKNFVGACQTKLSDGHFGHILGKSNRAELRYADNHLTLTYKGGDKCNHNNFQRVTVIEFICKQNAADSGRGSPVFKNEDDCRYFFEWETKYACLDHPVNEECRVNDAGKRYDLSSLVRTHDGNWLGLHDNNNEYGSGQYLINVCHTIFHDQDSNGCDPRASICYREISKTKNLGQYVENPVFDKDTQTIRIQYLNGDSCGNSDHITSTIYFICKPGERQSAPVLTHVSNDKCFYDFEWHTAAACVLGEYNGTDCKVQDDDAGFSFDLTPLKKTDGSSYTVSDGKGHDFKINVCGAVTGTKCDSLAGLTGIGICQVPSNGTDGQPYSAGKWSSKLTYFDGMINLTYTDGLPYGNNASTPRKSEITFLCDPEAGVGTPKYLDEIASEHYYGFEWRTSYACPTQPMECTASDLASGQEYDLSQLSLGPNKDNWMVQMPGEKKKFYFNVCRSLNSVHASGMCNTFASACTTKIMDDGKEVVDVADFGHIKSEIQVESSGRLMLTYEGQACNSTANYTTTVHFICVDDLTVSSPEEPIKDGPCSYSIIWNTASACPLSSPGPSEKCTIKNNITNYVYNLQPLMKQDGQAYSVKAGAVEYKLNICGKLSPSICGDASQNVTVCQVNSDGRKVNLAEDNYLLKFNGDDGLSMSYEGARLQSGDRVRVQIDFNCAPGVVEGTPEFIRQEGDTYLFTFYTSLACRPMAVDCLIQDDEENQYNLGSLSKDDGWTVLDTRDSDTKYYINVCKPVNNINGCPDEPIGGCQYASNGHYHNLGYIQSQPVARNDGSITIAYRNGDVCHKNTDKESHRSTRINFYCANIEEGPVFQTETELCEYVFTWRTPAACKLQSSEGQNCKAVDPLYNHQFDLSKLRRNGTDYHVPFGDSEYIINVCGPLQQKHESCDPSLGVGACISKPQGDPKPTSNSIGKGNSVLEYSAGELSLVYKDGQNGCQTVIKFTCDYNKYGTDGPIFIEKTGSCVYVFEWATSLACYPFKVGSCYVTADNGDNYDLSALTISNDNYEVTELKDGTKKKFLINVCHSLVNKANATCPYNAAVCMNDLSKDQNDAKKYTNLGEVNSRQVQIENGHVELVYTNGEPCGGGFTETYIEILCDENARETSPMDHLMLGPCKHHFVWINAAGCPIKKDGPDSGTGGQGGPITCQTTNPTTGTVYDLSSLKVAAGSRSWAVNDTKGHMFEFNICGPLVESKCTNASNSIGVCQSELEGLKRTFNAGNSVNNVYYEDVGIAVLNYTGGDRCHHGQYQRNTVVTFVCNNHNGLGRPVFLDEMSDCTYYISWHTDLVCENEVKCTVTTNDFHTIDLSPLSRHPDNIVHTAGDESLYYLSVCSALTPISGVMCPPGSGACRVTMETGKIHTSLGRPNSAPTYDEDTGKVTLIYVNGSQCDVDPSQNYTTKIIFSCLPGPERENPVFVDKVMCQYLFEWPTSVVCYNKEPVTQTDECGFHSYHSGMFFNFTALSKHDDYVVTNGNDKYYINPCKSVSKGGCASGMVCRETGSNLLSFGAPKQYSFDQFNENMLVMSYASGGTCSDGTSASSDILFECDREAGLGHPEYFTGIRCQIQFRWKTSLVCPPQTTSCALVDNGHLYDLTLLSKDNGAWNLSDSKGNSYWINICSELKTDVLRLGCGKVAAACRKSNYGYEIIGSLAGQTPLHKDNKTGAIVLEYGQGGSVCSHDKRRADSKPARTRINFICGNTYGGPVFNESLTNKEECLFEFTWKTKIACKIERQEVTAINGTFFDQHSGGTINLLPLWNKKFSYEEKLHNGDVNTYNIVLDGNSTQCVDSAVCLIQSGNKRTVLGTYASRKFNMDDDILEAVYTTNQKCTNMASNMTVTSIIQFHCNKEVNGLGNPVLISKSKDCVYIFSWDTPNACMRAEVIQPIVTPGHNEGGGDSSGAGPSSSTSSGGTKSKTAATVVGVFLVAIALCVLVVVFHKHERRDACIGGLRRLIGRNRSEYTQLPTAATDDFPVEDEVDEVVTVSDPSVPETNREEEAFVHVSPKNYHDDSDEDLLL